MAFIKTSCVVLVVCLVMSAVVADDKDEEVTVTKEQVDYAKGSICQYCDYCKFCVLCDEQCPCEVGPGRPACNMCKYCTYCKFCTVCDTVCQPGGLIDKVTGTLISALPSFNKEVVDSELDSVREHINKKRDEL